MKMKLVAGVCAGVACATLFAGAARAAIPTAGAADPVVPGQWHSNLEAATDKAKELNAPMFVVWGEEGCTYCRRLDTILQNETVREYFANSGFILVYEHSLAAAQTPIRRWVGTGQWPLTRLTWWQDGVKVADQKWPRPSTSKNPATVLQVLQNFFEQHVGAFSPVPADTSKDAYDPENDAAEGAAELAWGDQEKTEANLKLASKGGDEPYADSADWYRLPVVSGATYRVWFSDVSGIEGDAPQAAVYGDAGGGSVWAGPAVLASEPEFEFVPTAAGTAYIKVWRETSADTNILYTLHHQRFAPGTIEFVQNAVAVNERAGSVTLQVRRTGGTTGEATVQIGYKDKLTPDSGHTATAGQDFNGAPSPATLTWADGEAAVKTVTFTLIKNVIEWEGDETFGVTLASTTGNEVGPEAVVTLNEADPMVTRAADYTGLVEADADDEDPDERVTGTFEMKVSARGQISGKAIFPRNAPGYAGTFAIRNARHHNINIDTGIATIVGSLVQGRTAVPFELELHMESGLIEGVIGTDEDARSCRMFRADLSARAELLASLQGSYTVAFPVADIVWPLEGAPAGSGYATITVDRRRGTFRAAGKLPDGTAYSQSGALFVWPGDGTLGVNGLPRVYAVLFTAPSAYQGGRFSGVLCFGDANANGVWDVTAVEEYPFECVSFKPTSVPVYNLEAPGFDLMLGVAGGRYDRYASLRTVFDGFRFFVDEMKKPGTLRYTVSTVALNEMTGRSFTARIAKEAECVSWESADPLEVAPNASGRGFIVPRGDLVKTGTDGETGKPLYNYDTGTNPNQFQLRLTSSSGQLGGSFRAHYDYATYINLTREPAVRRWAHKSNMIQYNGILLQEQAVWGAEMTVGYGHYLYSSLAEYPGSARTYRFTQSEEIRLLAIQEGD